MNNIVADSFDIERIAISPTLLDQFKYDEAMFPSNCILYRLKIVLVHHHRQR